MGSTVIGRLDGEVFNTFFPAQSRELAHVQELLDGDSEKVIAYKSGGFVILKLGRELFESRGYEVTDIGRQLGWAQEAIRIMPGNLTLAVIERGADMDEVSAAGDHVEIRTFTV